LIIQNPNKPIASKAATDCNVTFKICILNWSLAQPRAHENRKRSFMLCSTRTYSFFKLISGQVNVYQMKSIRPHWRIWNLNPRISCNDPLLSKRRLISSYIWTLLRFEDPLI
jgi:hypothetical protein